MNRVTKVATCLSAVVASALCQAEVKIEEELITPPGQWLACKIASRNFNSAVLVAKGSRYAVRVNGIEGPRIEQLLYSNGNAWNGVEPSGNSVPEIPVVFSDDGNHCAYFAKAGAEYVLFLDGKEICRGSIDLLRSASMTLQFSPGGKHLVFAESDTSAGWRIVADGQPGPWLQNAFAEIIFSPDGAHYAYAAAKRSETKAALIVDGRELGTVGEAPEKLSYTADSQHLFLVCRVPVPNAPPVAGLLVDGKIRLKADVIHQLYFAPAGAAFAAVLSSRSSPNQFLIVNGKKIPGSDCASIKRVIFSPDGLHFAAICKAVGGSEYVILDGKRGQDYPVVIDDGMLSNGGGTLDRYRNQIQRAWAQGRTLAALQEIENRQQLAPFPGFTPDSKKFLYVASVSPRFFLVTNEEESDAFSNPVDPLVTVDGAHIGFVTAIGQNNPVIVIDGKILRFPQADGRVPTFNTLTFSPDGAHFAFTRWAGMAGAFYLDGVEQPGVACREGLYMFSPDGKHTLMYGVVKDSPLGTVLDGHYLPQSEHGLINARHLFTPDSQHLYSIGFRHVETNTDIESNVLFLDGRPTAFRFAASVLDNLPDNWAVAPDGVLTFVARTVDGVKRVRVTPSADTNLSTMLADAASPTK